jgi:hypothetical protein
LAYGFDRELFTIDQFLFGKNAMVLCHIDPLLGDEQALRGTVASTGSAGQQDDQLHRVGEFHG